MEIKKYELTYDPLDWSMRVEIAEEVDGVPTADRIKVMVEFWHEWESLLEECEGDYTQAFLKMLCRQCFFIVAKNDYNLFGVTEELADMEGWCKMDGSCGIKITFTDDFDPPYEDFSVKWNKG